MADIAQENCQKIKLLKLMEILRRETDEEHPITTSELCRRLVSMGISCNPRTLGRDVMLLNAQGYEILHRTVSRENAYYVFERSFSVPELKILIDAVQAAGFVTDKKTAELVDKIAALGGSHRASILKDNIVHFNTRKHSNERIYYNVDSLEEAIRIGKKIIFRYFDIDENGQRVYRRDGHHYVAEPVALVFNEDNYYLICYSSRHGNTANYRVDRMESVEIIDEDISDETGELRRSVAGYTESVFKMYGGRAEKVTLLFAPELIGPVYDKFGEAVKMKRLDDGMIEATVQAQISPTFWGWLFQFGVRMKIAAPIRIRNEYRSRIEEVKTTMDED